MIEQSKLDEWRELVSETTSELAYDAMPALLDEVAELRARVAELEAKLADAVACFEIECPCCGQIAASWAVSDGDSLECGCDGQISCCSETYPYASADDCGCGGDGYPKTDGPEEAMRLKRERMDDRELNS
jgi:hypothetical protein